VIGSVVLVIARSSRIWTLLSYLGIASLGTSMAVPARFNVTRRERRIRVAIAVGQVI
jgi:hypothetical protein